MKRKVLISIAIILAIGLFGFKWSVAGAQGSVPQIPVTGTGGVIAVIPVTGGPIIDAGLGHTCMTANNGVLCWGLNTSGQVGDGSIINRLKPVLVKNLTGVSTISLGSNHSCALLSDGTIWCWGKNGVGQLGNGTSINSSIPVEVLGFPKKAKKAVDLTSGQNFNCAVLEDNSIWCWGENTHGQLNDGTTTNQLKAVKSKYAAAPALISGGQTTVIGEASGYVSHWNNSSPTNIMGLSDASNISGNRFNAGGCAVVGNNSVDCWSNDNKPTPIESSDNARYVIAGLDFGCAVDLTNNVMCWGSNEFGQLGNGTKVDKKSAGYVPTLGAIADMGVGASHVCVIITPTDVKCWGVNTFGQLGNNTTTESSTPVQVILP